MIQHNSSEKKENTNKRNIRRLLLSPAVLLLLTIPLLLIFLDSIKTPAALMQPLPTETAAEYETLFPAGSPAAYPKEGEFIGVLSISSIGLDAEVIEGAEKSIPENAVAHPMKAPLPGEGRRILIDADSNISFKTLSRAAAGDEIVLKTYYGTYAYRVEETLYFDMNDASYRDSADGEELLIYVSAAPKNSGDAKNAEGYYAVLCSLSQGEEVQWK